MHLLPSTRRYHVLQDTKLLIHLAPPPPLNQTMCRLPCDLAPRGCRPVCSLLLPTAYRCRSRAACPSCSSSSTRTSTRSLPASLRLRLHLDNLPAPRRRRRQRIIILRHHTARRPFLAGRRRRLRRMIRRGGRNWTVRRVRRRGRSYTGALAIAPSQRSRRQDKRAAVAECGRCRGFGEDVVRGRGGGGQRGRGGRARHAAASSPTQWKNRAYIMGGFAALQHGVEED